MRPPHYQRSSDEIMGQRPALSAKRLPYEWTQRQNGRSAQSRPTSAKFGGHAVVQRRWHAKPRMVTAERPSKRDAASATAGMSSLHQSPDLACRLGSPSVPMLRTADDNGAGSVGFGAPGRASSSQPSAWSGLYPAGKASRRIDRVRLDAQGRQLHGAGTRRVAVCHG